MNVFVPAPARRTTTGPATGQASDFAYTYDLGGNRLSEQTDADVRAWQPNTRNQLDTESPGGALSVRTQFNAATDGNRTFVNGSEVLLDSSHRLDTLTPVQSGNNTLTLRAQDATTGGVLTERWQVTVPAFTPKTFAYDANGNLTRITQGTTVTRFYKWHARDRLVAWGSGTTVEGRFVYDSLGQRLRETDGKTGAEGSKSADSLAVPAMEL